MKRLVVVCSFFLVLLACSGGEEDEAIKAVLKILKDPSSANFGEFTIVSARKYEMACITVSIRNSDGTYEGDKEALLGRVKGKHWEAKYLSDASHEKCIELLKITLKGK